MQVAQNKSKRLLKQGKAGTLVQTCGFGSSSRGDKDHWTSFASTTITLEVVNQLEL